MFKPRWLPAFAILLLSIAGCSGGHSAGTLGMRTALDEGDPRRALDVLNHQLHTRTDADLPRSMRSSNALLVLDRATIQQSVGQLAASKRDYEAADKAVDALDLAHGTPDVIGRYVFSDSAGRYVAPPHEKLLVNILNLVNYLETNDLSGARIEARRMSVMARFLQEQGRDSSATLAFGSRLAGFAYEKSGNPEESRRYYDDARAAQLPPQGEDVGELMVLVGWGRVPHRVAEHVPVGLALTRAAPFLSPDEQDTANRLATQGLVTWVNYPTLAPDIQLGADPSIVIDGQRAKLAAVLDVTAEVRADWRRIEGAVMAAALTRTAVRAGIGAAIEGIASTSKDKNVRAAGLLLSLVAQITMVAADVPDTRSWETLPARLGLARVRVAPGMHRVVLDARGYHREGTMDVTPGGWRLTSLLALR